MVEPRTIDLPTPDRDHISLEDAGSTRIHPNPRKRGEWHVLAVVTFFIVVGTLLYVHNYDTASGPVAAPTAGSDSRSEPRAIPEMPFRPTAPVRAQE